MKYYICRFSEETDLMFKRNNSWTYNFSICQQYSKQEAEKIANRMNDRSKRRKGNPYCYDIVEVDKVEEVIDEIDRHSDYETYIAECMNERPYWI